MKRLRVTIRQLMVVLLVAALGLAGLKIAQLSARVDRIRNDAAREHDALTAIIRALRDRLDRANNPLELPDGYVIEVDPERLEVVVSIARPQGARAPLRMAIFDADSPTIPAARWKAQIELTEVGEQTSIARITRTADAKDPIRVGDILYSPAWSPNLPTRFALIGTIDADRDSKDDRDALKRTILEAGGAVDYDLPPPESGVESGILSPLIDWYVVDDRVPQSPLLAQRMSTAIKEARLDGIRPMPLARLLAFFGQDTRQPPPGRTHAMDR
jgi:hypothetical protein